MTTKYGERISKSLYRVGWWDMAGPQVINCDVIQTLQAGREDRWALYTPDRE